MIDSTREQPMANPCAPQVEPQLASSTGSLKRPTARLLEQATQFLAFGAIVLVIVFAFRALWVAGMDIHVAGALITETPLTTAFQAMALGLAGQLGK